MEDLQDACDPVERDNNSTCSTSTSSGYRLFDRQNTIHQLMGGGKGLACNIAFKGLQMRNQRGVAQVAKRLGASGWYPLVSGSNHGSSISAIPRLWAGLRVGSGPGNGHASLWECGLGHRSGLLVPGQVQSMWTGPGRRELVGAAQLDSRIPRTTYFMGIIIVATVAWLIFERSGLSFLTICSDVLLFLIVLRFLHANYATLRDKQIQTLPELVLSEEMVNYAATSFRIKVNYLLLMAHDITLGKDFRLFFMVVGFLWLLSVLGSIISFFTLAYIGMTISLHHVNLFNCMRSSMLNEEVRKAWESFEDIIKYGGLDRTILCVTLPALYNRYEERVDGCAGTIHRSFSRHYKIVDENVMSRLPRNLPKDKVT
ncbi:hypothetical protein OSB04_026314 [Centaurea solstitialis]|uniref:Reticulon-like protein n=1 Tax=Centaurea solstitialis TaxID=347529 RepID=A0AA38SJ52_9ASTR|nr:hypothetical protein OSB04_026314 [Centaurea solstitialis]